MVLNLWRIFSPQIHKFNQSKIDFLSNSTQNKNRTLFVMSKFKIAEYYE